MNNYNFIAIKLVFSFILFFSSPTIIFFYEHILLFLLLDNKFYLAFIVGVVVAFLKTYHFQ